MAAGIAPRNKTGLRGPTYTVNYVTVNIAVVNLKYA